MTENDLWAYARAKVAYKLACETLAEYETAIMSPTIAKYGGGERGHQEDDGSRTDRHFHLLEMREQALAALDAAADKLDQASAVLNSDERRYLHLRYRSDKKDSIICQVMCISRSTAKRLRNAILIAVNEL